MREGKEMRKGCSVEMVAVLSSRRGIKFPEGFWTEEGVRWFTWFGIRNGLVNCVKMGDR